MKYGNERFRDESVPRPSARNGSEYATIAGCASSSSTSHLDPVRMAVKTKKRVARELIESESPCPRDLVEVVRTQLATMEIAVEVVAATPRDPVALLCVVHEPRAGITEIGKVVVAEGDVLAAYEGDGQDRKSTRLNSSHIQKSRMPSSA